MPFRMEGSSEVVFCGAPAAGLSAVAEAAAGKLFAAADALLPAGQEHLCGQWSIADVDLALMLHRLLLNGDAVPQRLADYARRQWRHPAVQRWVAFERPAL
jgi:glutathione S-transferase